MRADLAFFEEDIELFLRPGLVVSEAVVWPVIGQNGARNENTELYPRIGERELLANVSQTCANYTCEYVVTQLMI